MKESIFVENKTKTEIDFDPLTDQIKKFLKRTEVGDYEVGIYFIPQKEIRRLNRDYRNKDKSTDVLSFPIDEPFKNNHKLTGQSILGDIFISPNNLKLELWPTIKHGLVHLLGFDHQTKTQEKEFNKFLTK